MALATFGVTHADIRAHYLPNLPGGFSATSNPTATTVGTMISAEAAVLDGALSAEGVDPAAIVEATMPAAYAWAQDTLRLGAFLRVLRAMPGQNPAYVMEISAERKARYEMLSSSGGVVLGDAPLPSQESNGPRTHLVSHSIDVGDTDLISDAIPKFRRSDKL